MPNNATENPAEREYFERTDAAWTKATGRQMNTLDFAYVEAWYEGGIPITCIEHGVHNAAESFRRTHRTGARIHSIAYAAQAIYDQWFALAPELVWNRDPAYLPPERSDQQ